MRKNSCSIPKCNKHNNGCNEQHHKECPQPIHCECNKPKEYPCGGWSEFRPLNCKDEELFYIAIKNYCGSEFIPLLVSMQVCEGYNFIFLAEKIIPEVCKPPSLVYIKIYLMHCGKMKLVSINDAHLYPEIRNDCVLDYCDKPCGEPPTCRSFFPKFY